MHFISTDNQCHDIGQLTGLFQSPPGGCRTSRVLLRRNITHTLPPPYKREQEALLVQCFVGDHKIVSKSGSIKSPSAVSHPCIPVFSGHKTSIETKRKRSNTEESVDIHLVLALL